MNLEPDLLSQIQALEKQTRRALPFTAIGLLLVLAAIVFAGVKLRQMQTDLAQAELRKNQVLMAVKDAENKLRGLQNEIDQLSISLSESSLKHLSPTQRDSALADVIHKADSLQNSVTDARDQLSSITSNNPLTSRVYIHILKEELRGEATSLAKRLQGEKGISVPRIILVNEGPSEIQLRYFRASEQEEAQKIATARFSRRSCEGQIHQWI